MIFKGNQKIIGETFTESDIKKIIYPVGSVIISFTERDLESEMIGTEWELEEEGTFIEATQVINDVDKKTTAGLPDITGHFTITGGGNSKFWSGSSGCFNERGRLSGRYFQASSGSDSGLSNGFNFKASNSNGIYGASQTVQPKSRKCFIYRRIV